LYGSQQPARAGNYRSNVYVVFFAVASQGCCSYGTSKKSHCSLPYGLHAEGNRNAGECRLFGILLNFGNNRVNRNIFTEICGGSLMPYVQHPCSADRMLFFLFDHVHLLKCVRNNWLGHSDPDNTFFSGYVI
jgi:hypothetical protein